MPREDVADQLIQFVRKTNIQTYGLEKSLVQQGLLMCRPSARVSFADALTWASARSAGADVVYSLDQRFPSDGLEVRQTP
jgi:predicted nucleic acid-binding protein